MTRHKLSKKQSLCSTKTFIYPERANGIETFLQNKLKSGGYKQFIKQPDFLQNLNADLEREGKDHHLDIFFGPESVTWFNKSGEKTVFGQISKRYGKNTTLKLRATP